MAPGPSNCKTNEACAWFKESRNEDRYCKPVGSFDTSLRSCTLCPDPIGDCDGGDPYCLARCHTVEPAETTTPTPVIPSTLPPSHDSSNISSLAIAGVIGLSGVVAIIAVIVGIVLLYRYLKRKSENVPKQEQSFAEEKEQFCPNPPIFHTKTRVNQPKVHKKSGSADWKRNARR